MLLLPLQPLIIHYPITPITCGIRECCHLCGTPTRGQVVAEQGRSSTHAHRILHPSLHLQTASSPHPTPYPGNQPLTPPTLPCRVYTHKPKNHAPKGRGAPQCRTSFVGLAGPSVKGRAIRLLVDFFSFSNLLFFFF